MVDRMLLRSAFFDAPLAGPAERELHVISPGEGPMPAVLVLAGFCGCGAAFLSRAWRRENLEERLMRLIRAGMPPIRLVLPDGPSLLGGSQWMDSAAFGGGQAHLADEVMPAVEALFPTTAWGACGRSSGGYGALRLAMERPGLLGAVAAHAPDAGFEYVFPPDFPGAVEQLRLAGGPSAWWERFKVAEGVPDADFAVLNLVAMSLCWSPEPAGAPFPCAFPVDLDTGELRGEVFARWLEHDPARMASRHGEALRALRGIWLDVGRRDEFRSQVGARMLRRALEGVGAPLRYEEHPGGHFKLDARFDLSLPFLATTLSPGMARPA